MNTTMAPIEQGRQDNLADLKRRVEYLDEASMAKREAQGGGGGFGGGGGGGIGDGKRGSFDGRFGSDSNQKDKGDSGSSGKDSGSGSGGGGSNDKGSGGGGGGKNSSESSDEPSSEATTTTQTPSSATAIASTTIPISVTSVASTAAPTSVAITSTTAPGLAAVSSTTSLALTPTTVTPIPTLTPFTSLPDSSSQPKKGLNTDDDGDSKTDNRSFKGKPTSTSQSIVPIAESVLAPTSTALALPTQTHSHGQKSAPLSPLAEHLLIAAGVIGACIIVIAGVYFLTRMMKINVLSPFRNRGFRRGGSKGWPGWRRRSRDLTSLEPPKYPGQDGSYGYPSDEKSIPPQRQLDAFFSPVAIPPLANPQTAATLSQADPQRQDQVREALLNNPAPFGVSPTPQRQPSAQQTQPFTQSLQQKEQNYNNTYNSNNTYNTNTTGVSRNTSDAYDPAQREVNHLSYLSSLSSGFGDAQIIIPESGPKKPNNQAPRQSSHQSRKFSWVSSVPGFRRQDDRDTVYTTASIESAPRYRTVNSWVAQQSNRVDRRQESDREVPNMPEIPLPLQIGIDHQRKASEDPAFKHHPGDEIEVRKGIRIPSSILDRNTGVN